MIRLFGGKKEPDAALEAGSAEGGAARPAEGRDATLTAAPGEERKTGFFERMRQAVSRTRESFSARIADIAAMTRLVDESALEGVESALLSSDLGVPTTNAVLEALRDRARHHAIEDGEELRILLKELLQAYLEAPRRPIP